MNNGSVDSLKWSTRWGLSPKSFQILPIVVFDSPVRCAIFALLQWVAFEGVDSNVATITSSTWSTLIERGRPGRSSSSRPSRRCSMNRRRHFETVLAEHRNCSATILLSWPSAQASTILQRSANACADVARRASRVNCSRSSLVKTNSALGRPVRGIPHSKTYPTNYPCTTLVRYASVRSSCDECVFSPRMTVKPEPLALDAPVHSVRQADGHAVRPDGRS